MADGDISITLTGFDQDSLFIGVIPDVTEVGVINRARTATINGGRVLGTFTEDTRPTTQEVQILAGLAAGRVADTLGHVINENFVERARGAAAFYAAALVEGGAEEPRDRLIDQWTKAGDDRVAAIAKAMEQYGAGDDEGPSDAELMPVYSFPAACPLPRVF